MEHKDMPLRIAKSRPHQIIAFQFNQEAAENLVNDTYPDIIINGVHLMINRPIPGKTTFYKENLTDRTLVYDSNWIIKRDDENCFICSDKLFKKIYQLK